MRRLVALLAALALAAGCGGDDDEVAPAPEGATGAAGVEFEPTAGKFISMLRPDKEKSLDAIVAQSAACKGVRVDGGFVLLITAKALDADPEDPLVELVQAEC